MPSRPHDQLTLPGLAPAGGLAAEVARLTALLHERDAEIAALRLELARARPATQSAPTKPWMTPRQLLPMYQAWVLAERKKKSKCTILSVLRRLMESELADKPIDTLTWMDLDAHKARRRASKTNRGKPPAEVTIDQEVCYLQTMLNWGAQPGRRGVTGMTHNPLTGYPQMKAKDRRKLKRKKIYTYQEEWTILACAPSPHLRALTLMVGNFIRPLEALWTERTNYTENEDGSASVRLPEEITKSSEERVVALPRLVMDAIRELPGWKRRARYPFENEQTGQPFSLGWMQAQWRKARELAGIEGDGRPAELYSMRHTGATRALNDAGVSVAVVAEMMGHKDWKQLERTYVHVQDDTKLRAVQLMEEMREAARNEERRPPQRSDGRVALLSAARSRKAGQ